MEKDQRQIFYILQALEKMLFVMVSDFRKNMYIDFFDVREYTKIHCSCVILNIVIHIFGCRCKS